jgi:hypothetical protein
MGNVLRIEAVLAIQILVLDNRFIGAIGRRNWLP